MRAVSGCSLELRALDDPLNMSSIIPVILQTYRYSQCYLKMSSCLSGILSGLRVIGLMNAYPGKLCPAYF